MASEAKLRRELDVEIEKLNGKEWSGPDNEYAYTIGQYSSGLAIDITKGGESMDKVMGQFGRAAMRAGYVVTATLANSMGKTRIFLHEADEHFDIGDPSVEEIREQAIEDVEAEHDADRARAEGFLAGLFFTTGLQVYDDLETLYPDVTEMFEGTADVDAEALTEELDEQI